jgi:hypothetical protein
MGPQRFWTVLLAACVASCGAATIEPARLSGATDSEPVAAAIEGAAHGFPALRDLEGQTLAEGEFTQWIDGDRLHVQIRYDFGGSHWIEERSVIRQEPVLVHERWSWEEVRDAAVQRRFDVDFLSGTATAQVLEKDEVRRWSEHFDLEPGRAFAGAVWPLAIQGVRSRLLAGEELEFQTVGFTPKPRKGTVAIRHVGVDALGMSGRTLDGDHFRIHAKIPWFARPFVEVPDSHIWLTSTPPAAFLRWEGPLAQPKDALVRVDLLPGEPSGPAVPMARAETRARNAGEERQP